MAIETVASIVGLIALVGTLVALIRLHVVEPELTPISHAVSEYGISPHKGGYRAATIGLGVAGLSTAVVMMVSVPNGALPAALLIVFAIVRFIISWVPMDAPGAARTPTGRAHNLIAIVTFTSAVVAAFLAVGPLRTASRWTPIADPTQALAWIMVVATVGIIVTSAITALNRFFGAAERALYLAIIIWLAVILVHALAGP